MHNTVLEQIFADLMFGDLLKICINYFDDSLIWQNHTATIIIVYVAIS